MSQTPGEQPGPSATTRAEELLDQAGQRIGKFAALTRVRFQQALTAMREEAERRDTPTLTQGGQTGQENGSNQLATQRAEEMVDWMGERLGAVTATTSLQIQKALARLREEAEDIWAEAESIRDQSRHTPNTH
jgi:uncharacterized protein YbjQ (UPF0145 family)